MSGSTAEEVKLLREELAQMSKRLEEVAAIATANYNEGMFLLRRIHHSSSIYLGDHVAMTFLTNGYRMLVDTRDRGVGIHLLHGGSWETHYTEAFKRMLRSGAVVLDVGANLGWYTLIAAPIVGAAGRVFAVEPNPGLARLTQESVDTNGFSSWCRVFQVAVGDKPGVVDLIYDEAIPGGGVIRPANYALTYTRSNATRVATVTLDDLLADHPGPVDVLKMDVEGWEGMAMRGMTAILNRSPGLRMLIEWSVAQDNTLAPRAEIAAMLGARGYVPFRIELDGSLRRDTWEGALAESALINLVLLPEGDPLAVPAV